MLLKEKLSMKNRQIIVHHGLEEQLIQLSEECAELIHAACRMRRVMVNKEGQDEYGKRLTDLKEEITDVLVILDQVAPVVGLHVDELESLADYKIDREIARMKDEMG